MIERIELESNRTDWAALLGRGALVAGTGYAGYKTYKDIDSPFLKTGFFRNEMSKLLKEKNVKERVAKEPYGKTYEEILDGTKAKFYTRYSQIKPEGRLDVMSMLGRQIDRYGQGYKGQSADLYSQLTGLYEDLVRKGSTPKVFTRGMNTGLGQIRLEADIGERKVRFDVSAVNKEGTIALGSSLENKYASRGILKDFNAITGEAIGADVALVRRYRESLNEIASGGISARDISRSINEKAIYEEVEGARDAIRAEGSVLQKIRREQVVVDPFQELTAKGLQERMKRLMKVPGYSAGSSAQFAKGIINNPQSLIASGLPGAAESASAYQLPRMSEFTGVKPSTIKWTEAQNFAEFKVATVNNQEALKRVLKQRGYKIGELAAEEILLNNTNNVGIKNRLYTHTIDLQRDPTKLIDRLIKRIATESGMTVAAVSEQMKSERGLTNINIDINEGYKKLAERKEKLESDLRMLNRMGTDQVKTGGKSYDKRYIKKSLSKVNTSMSDYGILGYSPDTEELTRLKGAEELENKIIQMRIRDDKMSIAVESHFKFGEGSKTFSGGGGGKWTVKNLVDVEDILEQTEWQGTTGTEKLATEAELKASGIKGMFTGTQIISTEAPIRIKEGTIAGREAMPAIMSYSTSLAQNQNIAETEKLRRLKELGVEGGEFIGTKLTGEELIGKIRSWHKDSPLEDIFGGVSHETSKVSDILLSADIHTIQSGFGGKASLSERAAYNFQALGLNEFAQDVMRRRALASDPLAQFKELQEGESLIADATARGRSVEQFADPAVMKAAFQENIAQRGEYLKSERVTIDLGKNIAGIEKVNIYASEKMAPYIGKQVGGDLTKLDRTTRNLISSVASGGAETAQIAAAEKYKAARQSVQKSVEKSLIKGKINKSMYGQAASSLEGMDEAAGALGKKMGMEGMTAPLIAMSQKDIQRNFGAKAAKRAKEGDLWGMITREPVEGIHSTVPVKIARAEDFGAKNVKKGIVYLSGEDQAKSMLRKSLFVDFDKDPLHIIAATTDKSTAEIKNFMMDEKNIMGKAYKQSLARMSSFDLKSRTPRDISAIDEMMRIDVNIATKGMEKGSIGVFSNEFKNIHIGLREQLGRNMSEAGAEKFMLGEDLSHLYIENILKAKHQSAEAIVRGDTQKVLDILQSQDSLSLQKRTVELQSAYDKMVFGKEGSKIGEEIRNLNVDQSVSPALASRMGYADKIEDATTIQKATVQAQAHRSVSSFGNIENVVRAHDIGVELQKKTSYTAGLADKSISTRLKLLESLNDIKGVTKKIMFKGLKNVGNWAILPTAAIGLAASLTTKPATLTPVASAGSKHEDAYEGVGEVSVPKTIFDIPEQKVTSAQIRGQVSSNTNFQYLSEMSNSNGADIRVSDHRAHTNKYKIEEMIKRGY